MAETKPEQFKVFATHVLKGPRFEEHSLPVSVLPELAAYRELLLEIARALFFRDNPGRRRVSKGFEEGIDLVLRAIGEGSAVAALERRQKPAPTAGPAQQLALLPEAHAAGGLSDYFEQARDLVNEMIEAMRSDRPVPVEFPLEALRLFNGFGRSLQADEAIEIRGRVDRPAVTYDKKVRRKLVLRHEATYEDVVDITGKVVHFDTERGTFGIRQGGRTVYGPLAGLDEEQQRVVRSAAVYTEDLVVRAAGTGAFDASDQLVRLVAIKELSFAEDENLKAELDIEKRLAALADLEEGWLDGAGTAIEPGGLQWLAETLKQAEVDGLPRPYLYPTPDGAVQAEWSPVGWEVSVLFDLSAKAASGVGVHTKSGAVRHQDVDLRTADGNRQLVAFVQRFSP